MKKYSNLKCSECGWVVLKIKNDKFWTCKRCQSTGKIEDLYNDLYKNLTGNTSKSELSDEWKKLTK